MFAEVAGELHHVDGVFAYDLGKLGVGDDEAFVLFVLAAVFFDVFPDFFNNLRA